MRKILVAAFSAALLVSGVAYGATAASATTTPTPAPVKCHHTVLTFHINKTDNGHGTPGEWADLKLTRTITVTSRLKAGVCKYKIVLKDVGTLKTKLGGGTPNGTGGQITNRVPGWVAGEYHLRATGHLLKTHGATTLSTGDFIKSLFSEDSTVTGGDYRWGYRTCAGEWWIDSSANDDGQGAGAGNITGKVNWRCFKTHHPKPVPTPTYTHPVPTPTQTPPTSDLPEAPVPTPIVGNPIGFTG
jgi:hypothetical protein